MKTEEVLRNIKDAFFEGYHSYATPASAYNSAEEAWEESDSKIIFDKIAKETEYHNHRTCNKCECENEITVTDSQDGCMHECRTTCKACGFKDHWAHGFFESSQDLPSNCKKYTINSGLTTKVKT